jgi:selenium metabolism protein YedF
MEIKTVDARGQVCPKPLILTKKALKERNENEQIRVLIDNDTSRQNVMRFLSDNHIEAKVLESNGVFTIVIGEGPQELTHQDIQAYCNNSKNTNYVIVIKSNLMGEGEEELGEILMKAFTNTIKEISDLPAAIILYNKGVFLATDESAVAESLKELESKGVEILICGTCVEYYNKRQQIKIGTISNMYTIMETLASAGKVIYP